MLKATRSNNYCLMMNYKNIHTHIGLDFAISFMYLNVNVLNAHCFFSLSSQGSYELIFVLFTFLRLAFMSLKKLSSFNWFGSRLLFFNMSALC